ncbi:glycoside hydrolase family 30 beta sandwich domain-containing protein [Chryseobacterium indoltheticum]|uniref:glycoside hydrolase family 30 beta sandwich domain-containing protein n=1 Tax=Chryseobacterium indoltheticum TaxID=254 RepID=UPI003F496597
MATVAFKTPEGRTVLIVQNNNKSEESFNIKYNQKTAPVTISWKFCSNLSFVD